MRNASIFIIIIILTDAERNGSDDRRGSSHRANGAKPRSAMVGAETGETNGGTYSQKQVRALALWFKQKIIPVQNKDLYKLQ